MSIDIKVKCNLCKKTILEGETFLRLKGNYQKILNDEIINVDELRNFWIFCDKCRVIIINNGHDNKIIKLVIEEWNKV